MQKAIEEEKWHKVKFEKSTKNNRIMSDIYDGGFLNK